MTAARRHLTLISGLGRFVGAGDSSGLRAPGRPRYIDTTPTAPRPPLAVLARRFRPDLREIGLFEGLGADSWKLRPVHVEGLDLQVTASGDGDRSAPRCAPAASSRHVDHINDFEDPGLGLQLDAPSRTLCTPYTLAFFASLRRRRRYSRRCRRAAVISFAMLQVVEHVTAQGQRSRRSVEIGCPHIRHSMRAIVTPYTLYPVVGVAITVEPDTSTS